MFLSLAAAAAAILSASSTRAEQLVDGCSRKQLGKSPTPFVLRDNLGHTIRIGRILLSCRPHSNDL
jgi:hypothetical protein